MPVRDASLPPEVDPAAVLSALGLDDARVIEPVSGGQDTLLWRVERNGEPAALRVFRAEQGGTFRREVTAMRAAADARLPVPRILAEGAWQERPALLLSWCPGRTLAAELGARPWRVWRLAHRFGEMHSRLHRVPPTGGRRESEEWIAWAGSEEQKLQAHLRRVKPISRALLHLDYHPLNVMTDGRDMTCVLDWANARSGDARADAARTITILRLAPTPRPGPRLGLRPILRLARLILELGYRRGYAGAGGRMRDMAPFYAWAGAAMLRDLAPRVGTIIQNEDLDPVRRWTADWKAVAGISP